MASGSNGLVEDVEGGGGAGGGGVEDSGGGERVEDDWVLKLLDGEEAEDPVSEGSIILAYVAVASQLRWKVYVGKFCPGASSHAESVSSGDGTYKGHAEAEACVVVVNGVLLHAVTTDVLVTQLWLEPPEIIAGHDT